MDEAWKQLPRAAVIVCASVLAAGAERSAQASPPDASAEPASGVEPAPSVEPADEDSLPTAPTCGAGCHGNEMRYPDPGPPPVEPAKKGCAVEDPDDHSPLGLALLGVGLLAGVAGRRRRADESSS